MTDQPTSLGHRITELAQRDPDRVILTFVPEHGPDVPVTTGELDTRSNQLAHELLDRGIVSDDIVAIGLKNSPEHVIAALAAWKVGAAIMPMRWDVPQWEVDRLFDAVGPKLVIADRNDRVAGGIEVIDVGGSVHRPTRPVPDAAPTMAMAIPSGGSTGASKAIVPPVPGRLVPGTSFGPYYDIFGIEPIERHLVFAPMYHGNPLIMVHASLFDGIDVILHERFVAAQVADSVTRFRPHWVTLAPTMMKRLLDVDGIEDVDWSCFHIILHGTAPCPDWLKRRFIDLVGAELLWEIFASTELNGSIVVRGDEWLARPGTIGRPTSTTELRILDENLSEVKPGEVGEIYMRLKGFETPTFAYLGEDEPKAIEGGFASVGDLGYVDEDGYVFSADRRADLIITGGANVVPAEVEAALSEHPAVKDVVVVGLPDEEWGKSVHAIVALATDTDGPDEAVLAAHCRDRLAAYKVPKSFEFVDEIPRSEMFKVRRSQLAAARSQ